jgi:transcriptional regulator with PAS, ATPase and Fis domain
MPNSLFRSHEAEGGRNDQQDLSGTSKEKQSSMKAASPDVLLHTKPSNMFCLTGDGRLCAYAKIPQEGKVALGDPQIDVKDVKSLAHFEAENIYFRQEIKIRQQFGNIIGQSDGLKYVLYRAEQVAPQKTTVLILGETGTGKELIAAAIHDMSPRKDRPLITVNCAALPGNLIESELFGREKGTTAGSAGEASPGDPA